MKKKITVAVLLLIGLASIAVLRPHETCDVTRVICESSQQQDSQIVRVNSQIERGALLIDVREPDEFAVSYAKGAKNIPLGDIETGKFSESDKSKKIYLYCKSGRRAGIAKTALEKYGYMNVENLGGLIDWQAMDGEVVD